jgi:hypothetical protein
MSGVISRTISVRVSLSGAGFAEPFPDGAEKDAAVAAQLVVETQHGGGTGLHGVGEHDEKEGAGSKPESIALHGSSSPERHGLQRTGLAATFVVSFRPFSVAVLHLA